MAVVINTKSRAELKTFFTTGSRPTAAQFGLLIDAMANTKDDSLVKSNASPLRLQAEQTGQPNAIQKVVEFYNNFTDANPVADLSLKSPQAPTVSGLSVNVNNTAIMFFNAASGNVGVRTSTPEFGLDINTSVRLGGFQANEGVAWPNVVWLRTADWDEGLIKIPSNLTMNGKSAFGIHFEQSRSFNFYTTNWTRVLGISKNRISVNAGIHFENQPTQWDQNYNLFGAFSDSLGNASILNDSANYNALMILGRKLTSGRRQVKLWDDIDIPNGNMTFGSITRQMLNLWNTEYGIGIQSNTLYFRSWDHFGWHKRGVHSHNQLDPGGGTLLMYLDTNGSLVLPVGNGFKPGGGSWAATSDVKLKKNITNIQGALDKLSKLRGVTFDWKDEASMGTKGTQTGMVAQEVEEVFPEWVINDPKGNKGIAFSGFEALVVESLKELKGELDKIKEQLKINTA